MTRATSASSSRSAWAANRVKSVNATKRETAEKSGIVPPAIWDLTSVRCPTVTELEAQAQSPAVRTNLYRTVDVGASNAKTLPEIGRIAERRLLSLWRHHIERVPIRQLLVSQAFHERMTIVRAQEWEGFEGIGICPKAQPIEFDECDSECELLIGGIWME